MIECCANSITSALIGIKAGANRIELCADLHKGGITPKYSDIEKLRNLTKIFFIVIESYQTIIGVINSLITFVV